MSELIKICELLKQKTSDISVFCILAMFITDHVFELLTIAIEKENFEVQQMMVLGIVFLLTLVVMVNSILVCWRCVKN